MSSLLNILEQLIAGAQSLGLPDTDLDNAIGYLENDEQWLCFDTIITQLYENEIQFNEEYYLLIVRAASAMKLPPQEYEFMKQLIQ